MIRIAGSQCSPVFWVLRSANDAMGGGTRAAMRTICVVQVAFAVAALASS